MQEALIKKRQKALRQHHFRLPRRAGSMKNNPGPQRGSGSFSFDFSTTAQTTPRGMASTLLRCFPKRKNRRNAGFSRKTHFRPNCPCLHGLPPRRLKAAAPPWKQTGRRAPPQAGPKPKPRAQAKPTPKATGLKSKPNIARAVLSIWHEKPHSLSYQARILAMPSPMTRVCVASKIEP